MSDKELKARELIAPDSSTPPSNGTTASPPTLERQLAVRSLDPVARATRSTALYSEGCAIGFFGQEDLGAALAGLMEILEKDGKAYSVRSLYAQAISLDAVSTHLFSIASRSITDRSDIGERLMRLALKAQAQCRVTHEAACAIQNPPLVFARQANFASGPHQINNGKSAQPASVEIEKRPNELLEVTCEPQRLDTRKKAPAKRGNSTLATVAVVNRPPNVRRKSRSGA